ncbi:protein-disulfide reductase DsbD [Wenzhouxiangella sediminis]|uniref:Thiol:disulfide interchange protein DsbD n=1 Tax=Wenzhouxiangella sediminis TaxID=1792836 RepID=A0A3E1K6Q1_9GAMM|nr:protein-disulfide reductase DsbD [Wenzhouxiangella sediminis]RFF29695.1 protein-disulfide reductase DsbD [Wenzhouxiangella sediminis]
MTLRLTRIIALAACLWPAVVLSQINPGDLLPLEEAFVLEASAEGRDLVLHWEIADGYYLYRHAFSVDSADESMILGQPVIPPGKETVDEFFGQTETFRESVTVRVPLETIPDSGWVISRVDFQGCADLGVCYPPHRKTVRVKVAATDVEREGRPNGENILGVSAPEGNALSELLGHQREEALPAVEAFQVEAIAGGPSSILVRATARSGYYLYRESFDFRIETDDMLVAGFDLPPGEEKTDEYFGRTRVFFGEVEFPLSLQRHDDGRPQEITLVAEFQGCLEDGICYPPMERNLVVSLPAVPGGTATASMEAAGSRVEPERSHPDMAKTVPPAGKPDGLARFIEQQPLPLAMGLFVLLGIGLAFTPCVFPMIPILSGIIAGEGGEITRGRAFGLSFIFVLAMSLTYTAVGVIAALAGYNLQAVFQNPWVIGSFAAIFVVLAMAMFGFYNLQMPTSWQSRLSQISSRQSGGNFIGAGIMGFLSALIVGPCVTAPLIGILIFISQTGDAALGGGVLFALSIGMGLPLLAIGVGLGHWLPRAGGWMDAVKSVFGVGLLALAIWMLQRVVPGAVIMLLWGALSIGSGVYLGALTQLDPDLGGWRKIRQALGVMLLIMGTAQFVGALSGGRDWIRPLDHLIDAGGPGGTAAIEAPVFHKVDTLSQLRAAIAESDRPVFLDFYADWCVDCVRMEQRTFSDPAVADRMADFTLLKADITDYNDEHQAMLRHFELIGPPAYLFFIGGEELPQYRMFGFLGPEEFLTLLDEVKG